MLGIFPFVFVLTQPLISSAAFGSAKLRDAAWAPNTDSHSLTKAGARVKCWSAHSALAIVNAAASLALRALCNAAAEALDTAASPLGRARTFLIAVRVEPAAPFSVIW